MFGRKIGIVILELGIVHRREVSTIIENVAEVLDESRVKDIARRIADRRKNSGISSQEMADYVGLGYEQYRRIERGNVLVQTEYLISISQKLKVSTDYLLFGEECKAIGDSALANLINGLSPADLEKAKNVFVAVFT